MSTAAPIVLILGSGSNRMQAAARVFVAKGYKTALVAWRLKEVDSTSSTSPATCRIPTSSSVPFPRSRKS